MVTKSKLFFKHIAAAAPDPILELTAAFNADTRPNKVNLGVGFFRTENLVTPVLECVKKAEKILIEREKNKEYLPIDGDKVFIAKVGSLIFGEFFWMSDAARICGAQCVGGTGALRIAGEFLKQEVGEKIAISDPTWPNHRGIFTRCGMSVEVYPYYDFKNQQLDFDRMLQYFRGLTPGTTIMLHAGCHNPTGVDLTLDQWKIVSDLFFENGLLPFFDFAYQGFDLGVEEDAQAVRLFAREGHEMLVACSQSKNFGLYGERVGALYILTESEQSAKKIGTKIKTFTRTNVSNPPMHGAKIVHHILSTAELKTEWEKEVKMMRDRIAEVRLSFTEALCAKSRKRDFRFLANRSGLFSYTGLDRPQVERLITEFGIYLINDGRINVTGLNQKNMDYVVDAMMAVL